MQQALERSKRMMNDVMTVVVRGAARRAERFGLALNFCSTLLLQGKGWNNNHQVNIR
jgi:hypothetical protein